jgi:hypothetical protein
MNQETEKPVFAAATFEEKIEAIAEYCIDRDDIFIIGYGQIIWMDSQESWIGLYLDKSWDYGSPEQLIANATESQLDQFIEDNGIFENTKFDPEAEMYEEQV